MSFFQSWYSWFKSLFRHDPVPVPPAPRPTAQEYAMKRALLVGINKYDGCPLQGCVNDVLNSKAMLIQRFGFAESDIRMILDKDATTKNILDGMDWLVGIQPVGGVALAFYHNSSHGTQVPTSDPSEADGLSECSCPVDFDWTPEHMITDKQYVQIFTKMPKGVIFEWISDSCHSGSLDRTVTKGRPRSFPIPLHMLDEMAKRRARGIRTLRRSMTGGVLDVGYVSGCRDDQTSADSYEDGKPCGAFTWAFLKSLQALPSDTPLSRVVLETRALLLRSGYDQIPQVSGTRADKPFLR